MKLLFRPPVLLTFVLIAAVVLPGVAGPQSVADGLLQERVTRMDFGIANLRAGMVPAFVSLGVAGDVLWDVSSGKIVVEAHGRPGAFEGTAWAWSEEVAAVLRGHLGVDPESEKLDPDVGPGPLALAFRTATAEVLDDQTLAELIDLRIYAYQRSTLSPNWYQGRLLEDDMHPGVGRPPVPARSGIVPGDTN